MVISTQGKFQVSLVLVPAVLGHILKQEDARKKQLLRPAGNLDQRRAGSAEISGHIANIRKCWVGAVDRIVTEDAGENPYKTNEMQLQGGSKGENQIFSQCTTFLQVTSCILNWKVKFGRQLQKV